MHPIDPGAQVTQVLAESGVVVGYGMVDTGYPAGNVQSQIQLMKGIVDLVVDQGGQLPIL